METSWISRKGGILEKGWGMAPLTNYDNNNNNGSNVENAPNFSLSDSKNNDQINDCVTEGDDTDIEDNLESDVLSNLKN